MKKIIFLSILFLLLSSCGFDEKKEEISLNHESLNCSFRLYLSETVFSGKMYQDKIMCLHFLFLTPEEISGIEFINNDGNLSLAFKGSVVECSDIAVEAIICRISDAIEKLTGANELSYKEGLYEYSDNETNAVLDENGNLKSISENDFKFVLL